jgi:Ca-activated chloride channel family protein
MRRILGIALLACLTAAAGIALQGCTTSGGYYSYSADFGATQGGVQDMGFARELVAAGKVPPPEAFLVEGMFSEHELGLEGETCERTLCLRTALGVAPTMEGEPAAWLQVGLSSTIDPDTFVRPSLTLIAAIDVSGSMGWEYAGQESEYPSPGQIARNLASAIAAELGPDDQFALVTYGTNVQTVLPLTSGDEQATIQAAIDSLSTNGSTNMEGGLRRAYEIAADAAGTTEQTRVMLFTDVQPNVGATSPSAFEEIVADGVSQGVGLTVMGVGVGLGPDIMNAITHLTDGNAFSLFDNEDVTELLADDWPYLVSPIAYDLRVDVAPNEGYAIGAAYGFPALDEDDLTQVSMEVSTVFLSRRKGALLVRVDPLEGTELTGLSLTGTLSYRTPDGELVEQEVDAAYAGEPTDASGRYFEQDTVGKTVALAMLVSEMERAAEVYGAEQMLAVTIVSAALERFTADVEALSDNSLAAEIQFAQDLQTLMERGAEQGNFYGEVAGWYGHY